VLAAVGTRIVRVKRDEEQAVAAAMQNGTALADDEWELLEPVEVAPLPVAEPVEDVAVEPVAEPAEEDAVEFLPEPPTDGGADPGTPIELPRRTLRLRLHAPPVPPEPAPPSQPPPPPLVEGPSRDNAGSEPTPVEDAEPVFHPPPPYPRRAVELELEGTVVLLALVKADGTVASCEVESTSGHEILDEVARKALRQWRFKPRIVAGSARPFTARVPFRFFIPQRG
jgi:protein TonB